VESKIQENYKINRSCPHLPNMWWIIGLVLFVGIILLPNILFLLSPHYIFNGDNLQCVYPLVDLFSEGLRRGHITCWNPYIWNGMPLLGNPNLFFSPPMALIFLVSNKYNIHFFLELHYFLEVVFAAIGFFLLSGRWLKNKFYRFAAAILYVCSTALTQGGTFYATSFHFAAIPWVLFYLHKLRDKINIRDAIIIAGIVHLQLTYGTLQFSVYSFMLYFCYSLLQGGALKDRIKLSGTLIISCIFAIFLSAYYLFPLLDSLKHMADQSRVGISVAQSIKYNLVPWEYISRLILPGLFHGQGIPWWPVWKDGWSLWESFTAYQGILGAVTILYGILFLGRALKFWRFLYLFIIFASTTSCGISVLYLLNLGTRAAYGRITTLLVLPGALICFSVLERLNENRKFLKRYIYLILISILLLSIFSNRTIIGLFVSNLFIKANRIQAIEPFLRQYYLPMHNVIFRAIILLLISAGLVIMLKKRPKWGNYIVLLLVLVNLLDLMEINNRFRFGSIKYSGMNFKKLTITKEHPIEALLKETDLARYRIHHLSVLEKFRGFGPAYLKYKAMQGQANTFRLGINYNIVGKLPMTTGYSSLVPNNALLFKLFYKSYKSSGDGFFSRAAPCSPIVSQRFLNLFSIKYLLLRADSQGEFDHSYLKNYSAEFKTVYSDDNLKLIEISDVAPRFYFPMKISFLENREEIIDNITSENFDPRKISYILPQKNETIQNNEKIFPNTELENISILKNECDEIEILVTTSSDRVLATTNPWHPWWSCYINGKPASIFRINILFSGVLVPKGTSTVKFYCNPLSLRIGLLISCIAWAALLLYGSLKLLKVLRRKRNVSSP